MALSFPRFGHPAVAWVALVPLAVALAGWRGAPGRAAPPPLTRAVVLGLAAGFVYFIGTVYWTGLVVATFGGLPAPLAVLATTLLAAYLAMFPAAAALLTAVTIARAGVAGVWVLPLAWTGLEWLRGVLFGGFPWVPLGNSQVTVLPVVQVASLFGVYGLSLLVATVNTAVAAALVQSGRRRAAAMGAAGLVVVATAGWGAWRLADGSLLRQGTPLRVGLVQGNVAQQDKWDPREAYRIFTTHLAMTRLAARQGAEAVLWPESSTPFTFEHDPRGDRMLRDLAREIGIPILFGSNQVEQGDPDRYYNAAFLLAPDGGTAAVYRKMRLVPFGEYVPLGNWLSFFPPLVQTLAGFAPFTAGDAVVLLPVGGHRLSTAICYEVVYPALVRQAVLEGSELLTTITNDAWYGSTSAPHQHFEQAAMRAIENGRYLARAANTGISGVIDPYGRVVARSGLFETTVVMGEVRPIRALTVYARIGDLVAELSVLLTLVALGAALWRRPW